jgi:alpha-glucosidase
MIEFFIFIKLIYNRDMKKLILNALIAFGLTFNAFCFSKLQFENGTTLIFEPCSDGSIRFEAIGQNPKTPVKDLELKKTKADSEFVQNDDNSFIWQNYEISPLEDGYTLKAGDQELYTSRLSDDGKIIREKRTWKTATGFYGFGQASRKANLSSQSFTIYNESKYGDHAYIFIPFYVTNESTAVYYNANGRDKIYFQNGDDSELYRSEYHRIECYIRQEASIKDAVANFYKETESLCILPEWAYGYIQSKYGYKSSEEVIELIENFKKHEIPLSAVVLDLYWFKHMGDIFWTAPAFSNYSELNDYMEQNDIKLITITEPFFTTESSSFQELQKKELLCKNKNGKTAIWRDWWCFDDKTGGIFNPIGKNAKAFMSKKYSAMIDSGIDGFWTDLGEPEGAKDDLKYGKYDEQDFHNYYNYYWTKALYEGVHDTKPDQRLFILSRSAGTGSGKFNVSVWSGDVSVSWPALKNQISYGLNTGISALPYWGSDVGGFVQPNSPEELYLRWQQFGAFTPVYRAHGTGNREPFNFSEKIEKLVLSVIKTRYRLLPYIYSTARQTMDGLPMMRGMYYETKSTPEQFLNSQYMFGDALLISPVMEEMADSSDHKVWLPAGTWYNFFTMEKISSDRDKVLNMKVSLETVPVFVKSGSIIPMKEENNNVLFVFPEKGIKNSFTLYKDDGKTEAYKKGDYAEIKFTLDENKLYAESKGKEEFMQKEFCVIYPGNTDLSKGRRVNLKELENGIEL